MMEYTTPPSYGSTVVNVGGVVTDDKILFAGASNSAEHTTVKGDPENDWPEPSAASYQWRGKTADGKDAEATLGGELGPRLDRVDIMAEVPKFVKQIVAGAAGTKPYIYQVCIRTPLSIQSYANRRQFNPRLTLHLRIGEEETQEEGLVFTEATFIS